MKNKFLLSIIIFLFNFSYSFSLESKNDLELKISKNLRCLICQGQSIYDSQSDFAVSVKSLIKKKISEGKSEKEIYEYFKVRYGDWILYEPEINKKTIFLWLFPLILFVFGGYFISRKLFIK